MNIHIITVTEQTGFVIVCTPYDKISLQALDANSFKQYWFSFFSANRLEVFFAFSPPPGFSRQAYVMPMLLSFLFFLLLLLLLLLSTTAWSKEISETKLQDRSSPNFQGR